MREKARDLTPEEKAEVMAAVDAMDDAEIDAEAEQLLSRKQKEKDRNAAKREEERRILERARAAGITGKEE